MKDMRNETKQYTVQFSDGSEYAGDINAGPHSGEVSEELLDRWVEVAVKATESACTTKHIDKRPLVTDDFGWHVAEKKENAIVINSGYDGHSALSREETITVKDMAEYFRLFGFGGYPPHGPNYAGACKERQAHIVAA